MTYRQIHTSIWKDQWFLEELDPEERLLFIYLFSNESTTLAGIYPISLKVVAFETGLGLGWITETLRKFSDRGKVHYEDGLMWVVNLPRYNATSRSPKVVACIKKELDLIPDCPLKLRYIQSGIPYRYGIDTPSLITEQNSNKTEQNSTATANVFMTYESEIGILTQTISDQINAVIDDYPDGWIVEAIAEAAKYNKRSWAYVSAILKRWKANGKNSVKKVDIEAMASEVYE